MRRIRTGEANCCLHLHWRQHLVIFGLETNLHCIRVRHTNVNKYIVLLYQLVIAIKSEKKNQIVQRRHRWIVVICSERRGSQIYVPDNSIFNHTDGICDAHIAVGNVIR